MVLGGVVLLYLTNRPEEATWLSGEQREWLLRTLRSEAEQAGDRRERILGILRVGESGCLCFIYFGLNTVSYGISMWLPNLIQERVGRKQFVYRDALGDSVRCRGDRDGDRWPAF